jgi:hypothetical protein
METIVEKLENLLAVTPVRAAALTGLARTRIFNALRDGELVARKSGKATIIEVEELRRWIQQMPLRETR